MQGPRIARQLPLHVLAQFDPVPLARGDDLEHPGSGDVPRFLGHGLVQHHPGLGQVALPDQGLRQRQPGRAPLPGTSQGEGALEGFQLGGLHLEGFLTLSCIRYSVPTLFLSLRAVNT